MFLQEWHFPQQLFFGSSLQLGEVPRASGMSSEDEAGSESSGPPSSHESSSGESVEDSNSSDAENESADQDGDASASGSDESVDQDGDASASGSDKDCQEKESAHIRSRGESSEGSRSDSGSSSQSGKCEAPSARPDLKIVSRPESLAEHMRRHPNNSASKFCGRCQFYRNRQEIESSCSCKHPMTGAKFTWIGEQPDPSREWGVGCHICAAAGEKTIEQVCGSQCVDAQTPNLGSPQRFAFSSACVGGLVCPDERFAQFRCNRWPDLCGGWPDLHGGWPDLYGGWPDLHARLRYDRWPDLCERQRLTC